MQLLGKPIHLLTKCWTWNWTWYWKCLCSLCTLDIPEIYSRFDEYFAIQADDECDSLLVCNILKLSVYGGGKFLTSLDGSRTLGSIGIKWGIGFKYDRLL